MFKKSVSILLLSSTLSGCLTTDLSTKPIDQEFKEVDQKLVELEAQLLKKISRSCGANINALSKDIDVLTTTVEKR